MKFLSFLLGFFCIVSARAQYPAIPTNKIVLGNQTTGDGLVYRGAGAPAHTPTTNRNAWVHLDTNTGNMYWYNPNTLTWQLVIAGGALTDGDKGDITVSADGDAWVIDPGAVGTSKMSTTGVSPGTYTNVTLTVGVDGRITFAESGSGGGGDGIYGGSGQVSANAVAQVQPGTVFQIGTDLNNPTSTGETIILYVDEAGNFGYIGVSPSILGGAALAFQDQNTGAGSAISAGTTGFAMAYASGVGSGNINITDAGIQISGAGLPTILGGNRGVVFPNLTTSQRDSIPSPGIGTVIYNTSANKLQVRTPSAWIDLH